MKKDFAMAYSWIHNILRSVVPLCMMCTLNCFIVHALKRSSRQLARSAGPNMSRRRTMSPRNRRVTLMLVSVIGLFIVCVTPDAIMSTVFGLGYYDEDYFIRSVREITDFLLTVNSACNFILYCAFNTVFRNRFRALITAGCRRDRQGGEIPRRRRQDGGEPAAGEVGAHATHDDFPRPHSIVVATNGHSLIILCSSSGDNMFELITINHEELGVDSRTGTTSFKQTGINVSDTDTE